MSEQHLHIITHDVPYPADFGGVIDLFYKIILLHKLGVKIHLHCFVSKRSKQEVLNKYCESVNYYKRKKLSGFSLTIPFIVKSRIDKNLLNNLQKDNYPILFEGIHTTYHLHQNLFAWRKVFLRLHNVEHKYYEQLAKIESNFIKKLYYKHEAALLKKYEKSIANKAIIISVSIEDTQFYKKEFHSRSIIFLPVFLPHERVQIFLARGSYCLYHGNLSINENEQAAIWLIEQVYNDLQIPLIIAGRNPSKKLKKIAQQNRFVSIVSNPTEVNMQLLIQHAQLNVLPSLNKTGVKLKLLNALYNGRHCILNNAGTEGSGLDELCTIVETENFFKDEIEKLFKQEFTTKEMQYRSTALKKLYNNEQSAQIIIDMLS